MSTHSDSAQLAWTLLSGHRNLCHLNLNWEFNRFLFFSNLLQCSLNLYDNVYSVMFIRFNPIYFLSACIHMWNYVWVMSCMATCCALFDLSWAAFCTVQSFAGETCSFERGRVGTRQSVDGRGRMALISDDVKQFLLLLEYEDSIRLKELIIFTLHRLFKL